VYLEAIEVAAAQVHRNEMHFPNAREILSSYSRPAAAECKQASNDLRAAQLLLVMRGCAL